MKSTPFQVAQENFTLVIFGASGSLAKLKLFPALYELEKENRMPKDYVIVGYARTAMEQKDFRVFFEESIRSQEKNPDEKALKRILAHLHYFTGAYDKPDDYKKLLKELKSLEKESSRVRLTYFSTPPSVFKEILQNLAAVNFNTKKSALRLIIEKPFGYDLSSAQALKKELEKNFKPEQIFLLDHYLGKEAVSNLLSLRYANSILTTLFSKEFVSNIQITAMEEKDIEGRANYFDNVGIVRDMVQSHLLQVLAYLTMYAPKEKTAKAIHHEKARLLNSVLICDLENSVVRGQYQGYTQEKGIPKDSQTETYAAIKLCLKHSLWKNVPIFIRSGKSLRQKWTGVVIEFKPRRAQRDTPGIPANRIVIQLQPTEKIEFHLLTKLGGKPFDFHDLTTGRPIYCSGDCLGEHGRLLLDAIKGDQGLFLNFEEIFAAWRVIDPLQKSCDIQRKKHCELHGYKKNSLGPKAADELIQNFGFEWWNPPLTKKQ